MKKADFLYITSILILTFWCLPNINLSACSPSSATTCGNAKCVLHQKKYRQLEFGAKMGNYLKQTRYADLDYKIKTVVIDPGHGGYDSGCLGADSQEKHLALAIAKKLKKEIEVNHPGVEVLMTRYSDVFIPLHKRASIANKANADLFISIHCNALSASTVTKGSETYVLGLHKATENLKVAKRENASVLLEDNYQSNYDFDPNSDEGHIMLSMFQNTFLEQSISFAEKVENNMGDVAKRKSRGVKQAGFIVLHQTTMPSVLIETGFLTNQEDEEFLKNRTGQQQVAKAIHQAFVDYKKEVEEYTTTNTFVASPSPAPALEQVRVPVQTPAPSKATEPIEKPREKVSEEPFLTFGKDEFVGQNIQFRVQLAASPKKIDTSKGKWNNTLYLIEVIEEENMYKYQARNFNSFEEAAQAKQILQQRGFTGAFVVAYQGGKRIAVSEALKKVK